MTRIFDKQCNLVHFLNPANGMRTLCGASTAARVSDLLSVVSGPMTETSDLVTCPLCAKVYCAIKNEPWNAMGPIEDETFDNAIYDAVNQGVGNSKESNEVRENDKENE